MNMLSLEEKTRILAALVEGNSIRATVRMTGAAKGTVIRLLREVGAACERFHALWVRDLTCKQIQADEVWSFVHAKDKNLREDLRESREHGSAWTFIALCPDCKLIAAWKLGKRDIATTSRFMGDLARKMRGKFQLSTDGYETYLSAVVSHFRSTMIDYAMIEKQYGNAGSNRNPDTRYSPAQVKGVKKRVLIGDPDEDSICTSHVERANLTLRMRNRRFTRLTNGFSKRMENHRYALAIHFFHYNFVRKHQSIKKTPAQAAGITQNAWTVTDMLLLDAWNQADPVRDYLLSA
jgi:IS1 family transposase